MAQYEVEFLLRGVAGRVRTPLKCALSLPDGRTDSLWREMRADAAKSFPWLGGAPELTKRARAGILSKLTAAGLGLAPGDAALEQTRVRRVRGGGGTALVPKFLYLLS